MLMDHDFGKPGFLSDVDLEKAAPSNPNFNSPHPLWDECLTFDSVPNSTIPNRQLCGHPGGAASEQVKAYRKRLNDRKYRERLKLEKFRMKTDMELLDEENENLKKENERLKRVHDSMNGTLQTQAKLIDQLKNDLDKLDDEYKKQNVLVQRLSELLACPDLQLENERLKLENSQLRRYASLDYNMVLAEENVKLKLENKVLRVQNDALCGKLISDSDKKHASELAG